MASTVNGASSVSAQAANMAFDPAIPSAEERCEGNRTAQGLKIYYDAGRNADIDIIAIPGFAAAPERNWTWLDTGYNWLSHQDGLQSVFPRSRIMIHQYNSQPGGENKVDTTIYNLAYDFLSILNHKRQNNQKRPMLFLAHSMGGLLVAQTLISAYNNRDEHFQFLESFNACVFFGTPFRGLKGIDFALKAIEVKQGIAFYHYLLSTFMRPGSKELEQLRRNFQQARERLRDDNDLRINVFSVFETQGPELDEAGNPKSLQVTEESAVIESNDCQGFARTHANLVRFQTPEEHDYRDVLIPVLRTFVKNAIDRAQERVNIAKRLLDAKEQYEIDTIIDWLNPPDISKEHIAADELHKEGTGQWLLHSDEFQRWFASGGGSHLWLYGKSGCGKTVLFYTMVHYLEKQSKSNKFGIAKFYFTFADVEKQSYTGLVSSLVAQLCSTESGLVLLRAAYSRRHRARPGPRDLEHILISLIADYDHIFICLDAIDECPKATQRDLLSRIKQLAQKIPNLKILATSQYLTNIETTMIKDLHAQIVKLDSGAGNTDIQSFLNSELQFEDSERKAMIVQHLESKAEGSFRWVALQLEEVRDMVFMDDETLIEALSNLPSTLHATYDKILARLKKTDQQVARKMIRWIAFAIRPLTLNEISDAVLIDPFGQGFVAFETRTNLDKLKDLLAGLVVFQDGLVSDEDASDEPAGHETGHNSVQRARLAHSSVLRYLISTAPPPKAEWAFFEEGISHGYLADSCLIYFLNYTGHAKRRKTVEDFTEFPLLRYSARIWHHHTALRTDNKWYHEYALLGSKKQITSWLSIGDPEGRISEPFSDLLSDRGIHTTEGRYYACYFGLFDVTKAIIARDGASPDINGICLRVAAGRGYDNILPLLFDQKFGLGSISVQDFCGALRIACKFRQLSIVQKLLDQIVSTESRSEPGDKSLDYRACQVYSTILKMLLANETHHIDESELHVTLLEMTYGNYFYDVVRSLLADGSSFHFETSEGGDAIRDGRESMQYKLMQLLLDDIEAFRIGVSQGPQLQGVSANNSLRNVALHLELLQRNESSMNDLFLAAAEQENTRAIEVLLSQGVDVNYGDTQQRSALLIATACGNRQLVELLLIHGSDVGLRQQDGDSALMVAVKKGNIDMVELFLGQGSEVNLKDDAGYTALMHAASYGYSDIVRLLLAQGATVNCENNVGATALMLACFLPYSVSDRKTSSASYSVEILLRNGASLISGHGNEPWDGSDWYKVRRGSVKRELNALQSASCGGNPETVELIFKAGEDNNFMADEWPRIKSSALATAAKLGHTAVVKLLLTKGTRISIRDIQSSHPDGPLDIMSVAVFEALKDEGIVITLDGQAGGATLAKALKLAEEEPWDMSRLETIRFLAAHGARFEEELSLRHMMIATEALGDVPLKTITGGLAELDDDKDNKLEEVLQILKFAHVSNPDMRELQVLATHGATFNEMLSAAELTCAKLAVGDVSLPTRSGKPAQLYEANLGEEELEDVLKRASRRREGEEESYILHETMRLLVAREIPFTSHRMSYRKMMTARRVLGDDVVLKTQSGNPIRLTNADRDRALGKAMERYFIHRKGTKETAIKNVKWLVESGATPSAVLSTRRIEILKRALGDVPLLTNSGWPVEEVDTTPRESPYSSDSERVHCAIAYSEDRWFSDSDDDDSSSKDRCVSLSALSHKHSMRRAKALFGYSKAHADQCRREDLYNSHWGAGNILAYPV